MDEEEIRKIRDAVKEELSKLDKKEDSSEQNAKGKMKNEENVGVPCPECGYMLEKEYKHCPECGVELEWY